MQKEWHTTTEPLKIFSAAILNKETLPTLAYDTVFRKLSKKVAFFWIFLAANERRALINLDQRRRMRTQSKESELKRGNQKFNWQILQDEAANNFTIYHRT
jgi:hypothetical protein